MQAAAAEQLKSEPVSSDGNIAAAQIMLQKLCMDMESWLKVMLSPVEIRTSPSDTWAMFPVFILQALPERVLLERQQTHDTPSLMLQQV